MPVDARRHLPQVGLVAGVAAFEGGLEVTEQPRAALAATADHHAVHSGFADHPHGVLRGPDVSVAQHRHIRQRLAQACDGGPVSLAGIELRRGAAVKGDGGNAGIAGDPAGVEVRQVVLIDAFAHLDGERDVAFGRFLDGRLDDRGEEVDLPRQCGAAAAAGHLGYRATEVEVDVVRPVFLHEHPHRLAHGDRIHAVQLDGPDLFVVVVGDDAQRLGSAFHEGAGRDHLRHIHAAAVLTAQTAERGVGYARHGSQDHGGVHREGSQLQGREFQLGGGRGCYNSHPFIVSKTGKSASRTNRPAKKPVRRRRVAATPAPRRAVRAGRRARLRAKPLPPPRARRCPPRRRA